MKERHNEEHRLKERRKKVGNEIIGRIMSRKVEIGEGVVQADIE
jgi:hypothetical protein